MSKTLKTNRHNKEIEKKLRMDFFLTWLKIYMGNEEPEEKEC